VDELLSGQTDSAAISRSQLLLGLDLGENEAAQRPLAQDERKDNAEQPGVVSSRFSFDKEDSSSTALLVIDMQVDFLSDEGRLPVDLARVFDLISSVNTAIASCQARGISVVHIGNEFPRFSVANVFRRFAAIQGTPGAALDPRVRRQGTRYFPKRKSDAFTNPELPALLSRMGIRTLLLAGVFAGGCVRATARGAIARGYHAVVLADCVASRSDRSTSRALQDMRAVGASVVHAG